MKDYAKIDTSEKMNKYEMAYYSAAFIAVLLAVTVAIPAMLVGLL